MLLAPAVLCLLVTACDQSCPVGLQRYGDKCVRRPDAGAASDADAAGASPGRDATDPGGEASESTADAGPQAACQDNPCGGCTAIADSERIGQPCDAGLGDCAVPGAWVCDGKEAFKCSGTPKAPGTEACGGGDEDCDGKVDESSVAEPAAGATFWFADCDGDGFAPMGALSVRTCAAPDAEDSGCNTGAARWIQKSPQTTADCSDVDPAAFPGQTAYSVDPIADTAADYDFDCDGEQTANLPGITGLIGTQNVGCDTNILSWVVGISNDDCYDSTSGFAGACGKTAMSVYQGFKSGGTKLVCGQTGATTCQYVYSARVPCR